MTNPDRRPSETPISFDMKTPQEGQPTPEATKTSSRRFTIARNPVSDGEPDSIEAQFIEWADMARTRAFILGPKGERWVLCLHLVHQAGLTWVNHPIPRSAPVALVPERLIPPPCRDNADEAKLLREFPSILVREATPDPVRHFFHLCKKRSIREMKCPEPWELVYGGALHPDREIEKELMELRSLRRLDESVESIVARNERWTKVEKKLIADWCDALKTTPGNLATCQRQFRQWMGRRCVIADSNAASSHRPFHEEWRVLEAQVTVRLDFAGGGSVWLACAELREPVDTAEREGLAKALEDSLDVACMGPKEAIARLSNQEMVGSPVTKDRLQYHCRKQGIDPRGPFSSAQLEMLKISMLAPRKRPDVARRNRERASWHRHTS